MKQIQDSNKDTQERRQYKWDGEDFQWNTKDILDEMKRLRDAWTDMPEDQQSEYVSDIVDGAPDSPETTEEFIHRVELNRRRQRSVGRKPGGG